MSTSPTHPSLAGSRDITKSGIGPGDQFIGTDHFAVHKGQRPAAAQDVRPDLKGIADPGDTDEIDGETDRHRTGRGLPGSWSCVHDCGQTHRVVSECANQPAVHKSAGIAVHIADFNGNIDAAVSPAPRVQRLPRRRKRTTPVVRCVTGGNQLAPTLQWMPPDGAGCLFVRRSCWRFFRRNHLSAASRSARTVCN